jgi:hypothetical protein
VHVLALCAEAGLVRVWVIAIDGTKIQANASRDSNRSYVSIVEELLADAERADHDEDELHGPGRGDEPPTEAALPRRAPLGVSRGQGAPGGPAPRAAGRRRGHRV